MSPARRRTEEERLNIARERSEGVSVADLAQRYAVSLKAAYNAVNHSRGKQLSNGSRPQVAGCAGSMRRYRHAGSFADQVQAMSRNRGAALALEVDRALAPLIAGHRNGAS